MCILWRSFRLNAITVRGLLKSLGHINNTYILLLFSHVFHTSSLAVFLHSHSLHETHTERKMRGQQQKILIKSIIYGQSCWILKLFFGKHQKMNQIIRQNMQFAAFVIHWMEFIINFKKTVCERMNFWKNARFCIDRAICCLCFVYLHNNIIFPKLDCTLHNWRGYCWLTCLQISKNIFSRKFWNVKNISIIVLCASNGNDAVFLIKLHANTWTAEW